LEVTSSKGVKRCGMLRHMQRVIAIVLGLVPVVLGLLFACALGGCGSSAIVRTSDGSLYEGYISGHTASSLTIGGQKVERGAVADIDHPGNVAGILGTIVASIGVLSAFGNCTEEQRAEDPTPCTSSGIWMLTGVPIAIYGWVVHSESATRAGD
jgi:hypothetical protein